MYSLSSAVIRALGGSRAAVLVLEERLDCRRVVASTHLPPQAMINNNRMKEVGEKIEGERHQSRLYLSLCLLKVLYSFLMCDF